MFSDSRCKNACKMLADLCPCFHQSPTRPNFGHSRVKVCPIFCRLRTKLCPNFGRSRARLCAISFAPCPFPNLAGTLRTRRDRACNPSECSGRQPDAIVAPANTCPLRCAKLGIGGSSPRETAARKTRADRRGRPLISHKRPRRVYERAINKTYSRSRRRASKG